MAPHRYDIYIYSSLGLCVLTLLLNWLIPWWQGRRLAAALRQEPQPEEDASPP
jgi:heme exporter protein D